MRQAHRSVHGYDATVVRGAWHVALERLSVLFAEARTPIIDVDSIIEVRTESLIQSRKVFFKLRLEHALDRLHLGSCAHLRYPEHQAEKVSPSVELFSPPPELQELPGSAGVRRKLHRHVGVLGSVEAALDTLQMLSHLLGQALVVQVIIAELGSPLPHYYKPLPPGPTCLLEEVLQVARWFHGLQHEPAGSLGASWVWFSAPHHVIHHQEGEPVAHGCQSVVLGPHIFV